MRFFIRKRKQTPTVIIVALIDILIVLLIFLMVTTTFKQQPALKLAFTIWFSVSAVSATAALTVMIAMPAAQMHAALKRNRLALWSLRGLRPYRSSRL